MTTTVHHQVEVIIVEEEVDEAEDEVVGVEEEVDSLPQKEIGPALIPRVEMLTLPGERAAIDVESTNLSTEVDPREPLRLVQAPPKRAKVSSLPMIGNVGSVAMSTGREGQLVTCAMVLNSL